MSDKAPPTYCDPVAPIMLSPHAPAHGAALLLHGLTGSPSEMELLAQHLQILGLRVHVPLLPGHCSSLEVLGQTSERAWTDCAVSAFEMTQALCRSDTESPLSAAENTLPKMVVAGLSFGALLSLILAERFSDRISHLVLISPPLKLRSTWNDWALNFLALLPDYLLTHLGNRNKRARPRSYLKYRHNAYPQHSLAASARLMRLRHQVLEKWQLCSIPTLVLYDPDDHLLNVRASLAWLRQGFRDLRAIALPGSQHELTLGHRSEDAFQAIKEFLDTSK